MSHYTIEELIARWRREELTAEQTIGQILQLLKEHERRMRELARQTVQAERAGEERERA